MVALKSYPTSSSARRKTSLPRPQLRLVPSERSPAAPTPRRVSSPRLTPVLPTPTGSRAARRGGAATAPAVKLPLGATAQKVQSLPSPRVSPVWRSLQILERLLFVCTLGLGTTTISLYSLTVQAQQEWMQEYNHLQNLERYERQLITASEILKNRMAKQAETTATGLVPQNPNTTIFLDPVEKRSLPDLPTDPTATATESTSKTPLAY